MAPSDTSTEPQTLPVRLREASRQWHDRLEATSQLMTDDITRETYTQLLARFYGYYAPIERQLTGRREWQLLEVDFDSRLKTPSLAADLQALGIAHETLPQATELPELKTAAQMMGYLYVAEGSTLGGQQIARHLKDTLDLGVDEGLRFFYGYGPGTGPRWHETVGLLTAYGERATDGELDDACQAANDTFATLARWLGDEA